MPRRLQKQILYGTFYAAICIALVASVYFRFVKPEATCFDVLQNQGEQGIDCGGPCAKACLPANLAPIALDGQILILQPETDRQGMLALIKNPNFGHSAENFLYIFSFVDIAGSEMNSFRGSMSLYAGESRYVLIPNFPAFAFSKVEFKVERPTWVPLAQSEAPPQIEVVNPKTAIKENKIIIEGSIRNREGVALPRVVVIGLIPGEFGQVGAASQTEILDLGPGELKSFSIIHPAVDKLSVNAIRIYPYGERP